MSTELNTTYTVKSGDTLWGITRQTLGKTDDKTVAAGVRDIIKANPGLRPNPDHIVTGLLINIPIALTLKGILNECPIIGSQLITPEIIGEQCEQSVLYEPSELGRLLDRLNCK